MQKILLALSLANGKTRLELPADRLGQFLGWHSDHGWRPWSSSATTRTLSKRWKPPPARVLWHFNTGQLMRASPMNLFRRRRPIRCHRRRERRFLILSFQRIPRPPPTDSVTVFFLFYRFARLVGTGGFKMLLRVFNDKVSLGNTAAAQAAAAIRSAIASRGQARVVAASGRIPVRIPRSLNCNSRPSTGNSSLSSISTNTSASPMSHPASFLQISPGFA